MVEPRVISDNFLDDEVTLFLECLIFVRKWLCWRKWLRVNGILEWALSGLLVYTDEGEMEPIYRYESSWKKYFSALITQSKTNFSHFSVDSRRKNITGAQIHQLMIREQRMLAIERQWCFINGEAIVKNNYFKAALNKPISPDSSAIGSATMIAFYRRICNRLAELIGTQLPFSKASISGQFDHLFQCPSSGKNQDSSWRMDNMLRTFDDPDIFMIMEMMEYCTINPVRDADTKAQRNLWITIPVKSSDKLTEKTRLIRVNLENRQVIMWQDFWRDDNQAAHDTAINLKLASIRAMLAPHFMPKKALYFQDEINVAKNIFYGNVLMDWIDKSRNQRSQQIGSMLACQTQLNELLKIVQLKNIVRLLVAYSKYQNPQAMTLSHQEEKKFFFFPRNGVDGYSPITEALLLLFGDTRQDTVCNVNNYTIHDRLIVEDGLNMNDITVRYCQRMAKSPPDPHKQTRLFSLWVTSLLFNCDSLKIAGKRLAKSSHIYLDTRKGFYLRHSKYRQIMMVFIPASQVPQYDRQWQFYDDLSPLTGDMSGGWPEKNAFFRLVLVRREDIKNDDPLACPIDAHINLDDSLVLCEFLQDIVRYFDPHSEQRQQLFRIDPFLSGYLDTNDELNCQLDPIEVKKSQQKNTLSQKMYLNMALWQVLAFKIPQKYALVRSSPIGYGPELCWQGISQFHKGIVPLEVNMRDDIYKLYVYDDVNSNQLVSEQQLIAQTKIVCTADKMSRHWLVAQNERLIAKAMLRPLPIVRLINWYDDHYPQGNPTIKKIISKRIYLINDVIAFCENPTKLIGGTTGKIAKVKKIYDWNFANYPPAKKEAGGDDLDKTRRAIHFLQHTADDENGEFYEAENPVSTTKKTAKSHNPFIQRVYQAMLRHNINYRNKNKTVRLHFYETPSFFILFFQCTHFWFPKWKPSNQIHYHQIHAEAHRQIAVEQEESKICYQDVPGPLVPLIQWALDNAIITKN